MHVQALSIHRMRHRPLTTLLALIWLLTLTAAQPTTAAMVVCVGADGHVALENANAGHCHGRSEHLPQAEPGHGHSELQQHSGPSYDQPGLAAESCTDYPLDAAERATWHRLAKANAGVKAPIAYLLPPGQPPVFSPCNSLLPPDRRPTCVPPHIVSIRTTVLRL